MHFIADIPTIAFIKISMIGVMVLSLQNRYLIIILATFGFNRTALRATQLKLHSMICALFLKIALSAAELMSFGHLGTVRLLHGQPRQPFG